MSYVISPKDREGTCYMEFMKGEYKNKCWLDDSILIDEEIFSELLLHRYIKKIVPEFDYYGITEINRQQWQEIIDIVPDDSEAFKALNELSSWAYKTFKEYEIITILGM